ncbi:hypothetical protein N7G274_006710 [Stereocaulon virgatum]|uniref:Uncharacterized protein n=1 Tax=Stereocaulon virgatum TaxID=373712 RepID=A0ABR4A751_9LECA
MDKSTPVIRHRASQRALRELSNGQSQLDPGSSYTDDSEDKYNRTPTRQAFQSYGHKSLSRRVGLSARRPLSKSHGDLSSSRPKSPPIYNMTTELQQLDLLSRKCTEDRENRCLPYYDGQGFPNRSQTQQLLPSCHDYCPQASPSQLGTNQSDTGVSNDRPLYSSPQTFGLGTCQPTATLTAINIQGLTSGFLQPLDFCIPYVRSHPNRVDEHEKPALDHAGQGRNVEHLDISTTWNGLRDAEAQELFRIHQAFTTTLERMLARELWQIFRQSLQQASASATHPLYTSGVVRGISFCRDQLVGEMADVLYSSEADMAKAQLGLLQLYLATNDCLVPYRMDDSRDTSITVRVYCDRNSAVPSPIVEAAWVPDTIMFKDLHDSPCEGEEVSIIPQYQSNSAFGTDRLSTNISYIISSPHHPLTWLTWDDNTAGFRGVVPIYSEAPGSESRSHRGNPCTAVKELCIEIKAILTDDNGSVLRYERVLRARLTFKITPWFARDSASRPGDVSTGRYRYQRTKLTSADEQFTSVHAAHHCSTGKEPLHGHAGYLKTGRCSLPSRGRRIDDRCSQEYSTPSLSITTTAVNAIECSILAQQHADLAAKYADLAQRHADAEEHVKLLGLPRDFSVTKMHQPDLQVYFTGHLDAPSSVKPTGHQRPPSGSSTSSRTSVYNSPSPIPYARDATQHPIVRARDATRDLILGSRVAPGVQISPRLHRDSYRPQIAPVPTVNQSENFSPQFTALPPPALHIISSQTFDEVSQCWNRVQTSQGSPVDRSHVSLTPTKSTEDEPSPSVSGSHSRKRRAKSSLSELLPPKKSRENGIDSNRKPSTSMIFNEEGGKATTQSEGNAQDVRSELCDCTDIEETESAFRLSHVAARTPFGLPTPDSLSNSSRAVSLVLASTGNVSRVPSSELDIIVEEDPQTRKASRREQAMLWNFHSRSVDSDKENQLDVEAENGRMTTEEKQAMEEAIERSIDDLVGRLDEAFLAHSSSGSSTEDDELEDLVNYGF